MTLHKKFGLIAGLIVCLLSTPRRLQGQSDVSPMDADSTVLPGVDTTGVSVGQPQELWVGLGAGTGVVSSQELLGVEEVSAAVGGFIDESHWIHFSASYMHTPLPRTSNPEYAIAHGLSVAELQADIRFYTPPRYSFLGHYFFIGAGVDLAFWKYDPQTSFAGSGGDNSDYLLGYDLHLGTGFVLGQFWPLSLNLDLIPGIVLWSSGTDQEYSRADLPTLLYFRVRVQLSYSLTAF